MVMQGLQLFWIRKHGGPGVTLSPQGIEVRSVHAKPFQIDWADVQDIRRKRFLRSHFLVIDRRGKMPIRISAEHLPLKVDEALVRIHAYRRDVMAAREAAAH